MGLLNDEIREQVEEMLQDLSHDVRLIVFTKSEECEYCDVIQDLTREVAETSDKISVEVYDLTENADMAKEYEIDKAPAIAIIGDKDYGMRFFGVPANYEFSTLLHGIQAAGMGMAGQLDEDTKAFLETLKEPVHYQVFVTPTCPYCPAAAVMAFDMAVQSDMVRSEVVEASEFQDLASQYNVMGVPLNVINETQRVEGRAPAHMIVDAIKEATS